MRKVRSWALVAAGLVLGSVPLVARSFAADPADVDLGPGIEVGTSTEPGHGSPTTDPGSAESDDDRDVDGEEVATPVTPGSLPAGDDDGEQDGDAPGSDRDHEPDTAGHGQHEGTDDPDDVDVRDGTRHGHESED